MHFRRTGAVLRLAILTAVLTWFAQTVAEAADAVTLRTSIKDHRFQPTELKAPANTPITLVVRNLDPTPEEFESKTLRVEKSSRAIPRSRSSCARWRRGGIVSMATSTRRPPKAP
jgi:Cupredoxin-like domain